MDRVWEQEVKSTTRVRLKVDVTLQSVILLFLGLAICWHLVDWRPSDCHGDAQRCSKPGESGKEGKQGAPASVTQWVDRYRHRGEHYASSEPQPHDHVWGGNPGTPDEQNDHDDVSHDCSHAA